MRYCGGAGWVYAAREEGTPLVKIGYTGHQRAETRVDQLRFQFRTPFTLAGSFWIVFGVTCLEHALHAKLATQRIDREFFYIHMNQAIFQALVDVVLPDVRRELRPHMEKEIERLSQWNTLMAIARGEP